MTFRADFPSDRYFIGCNSGRSAWRATGAWFLLVAGLSLVRIRAGLKRSTKLDRLARSLPDARDIVDELTSREVKLNRGGSIHDPSHPVGRLLFNVLAMVAEFESDLIRMRTREGMKVAKARGRLRGKQPKLNPKQEAHLVSLHAAGEHTNTELGELFGVGRSTVYLALDRSRARAGS